MAPRTFSLSKTETEDDSFDAPPSRVVASKKKTGGSGASAARAKGDEGADATPRPLSRSDTNSKARAREEDETVNRPRKQAKTAEEGENAREKTLAKQVESLNKELHALRSSFEALSASRTTEAEESLQVLTRTSDERHKRAQELISTLKAQLEQALRSNKPQESASVSAAAEARGETAGERAVREQLDRAERRNRDLERRDKDRETEIAALQKEVMYEREKSAAVMRKAAPPAVDSGASNRAATASQDTTAAASSSEERVIRNLYEDLTGIVFSGVEVADRQRGLRRFKAVFAGEGYYDMEFSIEESFGANQTASAPASDLVFVPHLDAARDAALLRSKLPDHLRVNLRFGRNSGVRFLGRLSKGLAIAK